MEMETLILIYVVVLVALVLLLIYLNCCIIIVKQGTKKVVERLGVYRRTLNAGFHFIFKPLDRIAPVPWEILSKKEQQLYLKTKQDIRTGLGLERDVQAIEDLEKYADITAKEAVVTQKDPSDWAIDSSWNRKLNRIDYVDMRERFLDFEDDPQSVITKDNAVVKVDTCVFFQVTDVFSYYYGANEPEKAIKLLAVTTLRNVVGSLTLEETLVSRKEINTAIRQALEDATNPWGIKVNRVEIKEFILEDEVKNALNTVLIAEREKRATILRAEGEATRIELTRTAEALGYEKIKEACLDEAVLKVRGYEALKDVANGTSTKIFLPNDLSNLIVGTNLIADAIDDKKKAEVKPEANEELKENE